MMRALIVSHYLSPGGLSALIESQLHALEADGVECLLVGPSPVDDRLARNFSVSNLEIPPAVQDVFSMARAVKNLKKVIKLFTPDVIAAHGYRACLATALVPSGAAKMFVNHGDVIGGKLRPLAVRTLALFPNSAISNFPISNSRWTYSRFLSPAVLNSEPVNAKVSGGTTENSHLRVGWFARVDKPKRPDIWLEITKKIVSQIGDAEGVLIGNIEALDEDLARVLCDTPRVHAQPWGALENAMSQMDVLVAWSDAEGQLPLAAQEAIWRGVPVVTNRLPSIEAFWGQGALGMVDDRDGAIRELKRLVDPAARRELLLQQQLKLESHRKEPDLAALTLRFVREVRSR